MLHFERTNSNVKTCGISMWKIEIVLCYPRGCTWFVFVEIFQIRRKPEWASSVWLLGSLRINRFLTLIAKYIIWTNERDDIKKLSMGQNKKEGETGFLVVVNEWPNSKRKKKILPIRFWCYKYVAVDRFFIWFVDLKLWSFNLRAKRKQ